MTVDEMKLITPGDIYNLLGIAISYSRTKCALLPYEALVAALTSYERGKK